MLVANRGEIAVRVIETLRALGVRSIAVYSDEDADAPHVALADDAVRLGSAPPAKSYLNAERVLDAARRTGAEAIHPGYGFLSENAAFARACAAAGIVFVGPPPETIEMLGDKVAAKLAAREAGVPVLEGLQRSGLADREIIAWAGEDERRLPLMVKAAAGGGGRGMRIVHDVDELPEALAAARREAAAGFGDDAVFVERYVERARHIEVQLLADAHGSVVHLGERECSLQRRHQKVLEESPSPVVDDALRSRLGEAAVALARVAGYVGAGTAEFLVPYDDPGSFAFLEVNTRLQVEHPVTELVCGVDLVALQLRVAAGEPLGFSQDAVALRGHAVEVRVCAEDATAQFLPATGEIAVYRAPAGEGIRVDSGVRAGSRVSASYDSLLLKLIGFGADRATALERVGRALADLRILGVTTNAGYLSRLVAAAPIRDGELDTGLLERGVVSPAPAPETVRDGAVAIAAADREAARTTSPDPWDALFGRRLTGEEPVTWRLAPPGGGGEIAVALTDREARVDGEPPRSLRVRRAGDGRLRCELAGRNHDVDHAFVDGVHWVAAGADSVALAIVEPVVEGRAAAAGTLQAPMPGAVLSVRVSAGDTVGEGDLLVVIESMKMELTILAPHDATVTAVEVAAGEQVRQGQPLVALEATGG